MKINSRILKIINFLKENNSTTIKEISSNLNLSERTVRYNIENINFLLKNFNQIQIKKGSKGKIEFKYDDNVEKILSFLLKTKTSSYKERYDFLYFKILYEETINITKISKNLDVSRVTLTKDLKNIYYELEKKGFDIYNNTIINKNETLIRKEIVNKFYLNILKFSKLNTMNLLKNYLSVIINNSDLSGIIKFLDNLILNKKSYNKFYDLVYVYILVTCIRIKNKKFIKNQNKSFLKFTLEYELCKKNIFILEESFNIKFSKDEIINLTDVILGIFSNLYNSSIYQYIISLKVLLKQVVNNISKILNIDLSHDELLMERLYMHIKSCIYRIKNNLNISEELYIDEVNDYLDLLKIIKKEIFYLEKNLEIKFSDADISLIALHFISSIERNLDKKLLKVVLVCNSGYGTSVLLRDKIEKDYSVKIIDNISYLQLKNFDMESIDLIVSSIPLKNNLYKKPTLQINMFFKKDTEKLLNSYGIYKKSNIYFSDKKLNSLINIIKSNTTIHNEEKLIKEIYEMFNISYIYHKKDRNLFDHIKEDDIFFINTSLNWKKSLDILSEKLLKKRSITKEYIKEILNVIKSFGAYFVIRNNIAVPHGQIDKNVLKNGISILYLKDGIIFPEKKLVKLIVLVASTNKNILINTIKRIDDISNDSELYNKLNNYNKKEFIKYLKGEQE